VKSSNRKNIRALQKLLLTFLLFLGALAEAADRAGTTPQAPAVEQAGAVIKEVRLNIDAHPDRQPTHTAIAERIIDLQAGDPLNAAVIRSAVESLKASHRFATIHVESFPESDGEILVFTLTPYGTIKDIRIRGGYPLFERDILNQMTLYPGDPYTEADLSEQIASIAERYRREGYIDPQVSVSAQRKATEDNAVIHVDIEKGPHYVLGDLVVEGNRGLSENSLKWRMGVWRTALVAGIGRFSEYRLKKDVDHLLAIYRRKGFADAKIDYRIDEPDANHRVNVGLRIAEGFRYRIRFDGNRQFWDRTLKKDITLFSQGNRRNSGVRRSIRKMQDRYRQAGYLDARIEAQTTDTAEADMPVRLVRFLIREGPRTLVDRVSMTGNQNIPDSAIQKQILTRPPSLMHSGAYVAETLDADRYAVTSLYGLHGYLDATVDSAVTFNEDDTLADIALKIDEGPRTMVRSVSIQGLTVLPEAEVQQVLVHHRDAPLQNTALDTEKEAITSLIAEQGYPHARVKNRLDFNADRTLVDIVYTIEQGPHVCMGDIFVSGNLRTRESIIRRELEVQPGSSLSLRRLHDGQRRLRDLAIFHGVQYRTLGLKEQKETINLFVEVEENKPYYVQVGGGYESDSGFFGRTRIGDRNLFGLNKDLWAGAEVSETGHRVETRLTEPRFLGTRTTASIGAFVEELTEFNQSFGTRTTGGTLGFGRKWGESLSSALVFNLEKRDLFGADNRVDTAAAEESRTIFVTTPTIRYDTRDSFVRPTQGVYSSLKVDISSGFENRLDDFVRYQFDNRLYFTPIDGLTLAAMARIGQVFPYSDTDTVSDDQLFYLGGIRDVRGFKENLLRFNAAGDPVGGKTAMAGSLEARIDLGLNWELTTFFDIGSVRDALVEDGSDQFRTSVGIGLRYITPIGPMGVLYGHKLDRKSNESAGRLHVSIGYSF